MEVEFSEEKLAVACERASKRVTTYITEEIPPYVKEHYAELLDHDLAWRMALESRRLDPDADLEQLFQSACFMKDTESLNQYIIACTKLLWLRLECLCLNVLREFVTDLNDEIDFPFKVNPSDDFLLDSDPQRKTRNNNTAQSPEFLSSPLGLPGSFPSATAMKTALAEHTFRLFSFLLPSLLSGRLSLPGAVLGSIVSGSSTASTGMLATTTACITGAVQGALAAPLGGLALLAGAIATKALVNVDYKQYTGALSRVVGLEGETTQSATGTSPSENTKDWTRDKLQRRAVDSLLETVANPVVLANLRESIARLLREEVAARALSLQHVDLANSALCSSQRFFSLSTTFDQWRVLAVELDACTINTTEIGYCISYYEGYERKQVSRRFSAFRQLYLTLCKQFPAKQHLLAGFPPRTIFTCTEIGFLHGRCSALLAWLKVVEADQDFYQAQCVNEFLRLNGAESEIVAVEGADEWLLLDSNDEATTVNFSLNG